MLKILNRVLRKLGIMVVRDKDMEELFERVSGMLIYGDAVCCEVRDLAGERRTAYFSEHVQGALHIEEQLVSWGGQMVRDADDHDRFEVILRRCDDEQKYGTVLLPDFQKVAEWLAEPLSEVFDVYR